MSGLLNRRGKRFVPLIKFLPRRGLGFAPGTVEVVPLRHTVVPLKCVVHVVQGVVARVERREYLAVGEVIPRGRVAADSRLDFEAVDV